MKCINCGSDIPNIATFCPKCGARQEFDQELINRAAQGETMAETELYNATYNTVYALVKSMVKDEDTVLDILQDSYVKAFRNLHQLQEANKFRPWLKTIARNRTMDHFRERKTVLFSEMAPLDDENADVEFEDTNPEAMPEVVIDRQETSRLIAEILDALPDDQRGVISMFYYEQMSVKEIAEQLSVSENTVKSRLNYGRKKIEERVLDLEKKGTKLYGLAPVAFLIMLMRRQEAFAMRMNDVQASLQRILQRAGGGIAETGTQAGQQVSSQMQQTGVQPVQSAAQSTGTQPMQSVAQSTGAQPVQAAVQSTGAQMAQSAVQTGIQAAAVKAGVPLAAKIAAAVATVAVVGVGAAVVIPAVTDRVSGGVDVASNEMSQDAGNLFGIGDMEEEEETLQAGQSDADDASLTGQSDADEASAIGRTDEADRADSGETADAVLTPVRLSQADVEELDWLNISLMHLPESHYNSPEEIAEGLRQNPELMSMLIFFECNVDIFNDATREDDRYWYVDHVDTSGVDNMLKELLDMEYDYRLLPEPGNSMDLGACYYEGGVTIYGVPRGLEGMLFADYVGCVDEDDHSVVEYDIAYWDDYIEAGGQKVQAGSFRTHVSKADNSYGFRIVGLEIDWFDE